MSIIWKALMIDFRDIQALRAFDLIACGYSAKAATISLGLSRQTVLDRLKELSESYGDGEMLVNHGRLTSSGLLFHARIRDDLGRLWQNLEDIELSAKDNEHFFSQAHSLTEISKKAVPIIQNTWRIWRETEGDFRDDRMNPILPWSMILRNVGGEWVYAVVGVNSSFSTWFGVERARKLQADGAGELTKVRATFRNTGRTYDDVIQTGAPVYHHFHVLSPRHPEKPKEWVSFQRLIVPLILGDDDMGVGNFIARTNQIEIDNLPIKGRKLLPDDLLMDEDPFENWKL